MSTKHSVLRELADAALLASLPTHSLPRAQIDVALCDLQDGDPDLRNETVRALWGVRDAAARAALGKLALRDPDVGVRHGCVLAAVADPDFAEETLVEALADPAPPVRLAALRALRNVAPPRVREQVRLLLDDSDDRCADLARRRLAEAGDACAPAAPPPPALLERLGRAGALFASVTHRAFAALVATTEEATERLRSKHGEILESLQESGHLAARPTLGLRGPARRSARSEVELLAEISHDRPLPHGAKPPHTTKLFLVGGAVRESCLLGRLELRDPTLIKHLRAAWLVVYLEGHEVATLRFPAHESTPTCLAAELREPIDDGGAPITLSFDDPDAVKVEIWHKEWGSPEQQ